MELVVRKSARKCQVFLSILFKKQRRKYIEGRKYGENSAKKYGKNWWDFPAFGRFVNDTAMVVPKDKMSNKTDANMEKIGRKRARKIVEISVLLDVA